MEGRLFFPQGERDLRVTVEAFAMQHRKGSFESWRKRIHLAGAWGPIIEQCLKPIAVQRPTAQEVLARVQCKTSSVTPETASRSGGQTPDRPRVAA